MSTIANVVTANGALHVGTAGAHPETAVGYTEGGVEHAYEPSIAFVEVHEETVPIDAKIDKEKMTISCALAEGTLANLEAAMAGASLAGDTNTLGGGTLRTISARIVGAAPGTNHVREILLVRCCAIAAVGLAFKRTGKTVVPVQFQALRPLGNFDRACEIADVYDTTLSAAGALTVAPASARGGYRVEGYGGAADVLASVSGGSSGDVVELRIASAAHAITVTDNGSPTAGQIGLAGAADFVMNNMLDRLTIQKQADGSWLEVSRIDA